MVNRRVAVALSLLLASPGFAVAPAAQGAACAQIAVAFDRETKAFVNEAEQKNIGFLNNQIFAQQTEALKTLMENSTQGTIAVDMKEEWDKMKAQVERIQNWEESLRDLYLCAQPGSSCNMTSFLERVSPELRQWFDSFTNAGLAAVRERALEAANLIHSYLDRVTKITTNTMDAMAECAVPMRGQPRVDPNTGQPVITSTAGAGEDAAAIPEPTAKPVDPAVAAANGGGNGLIWTAVGVAGVAYGVYELVPRDGAGGGAQCNRPTSNPLSICSSQGGSSAACQNSLSAWGAYCQCTGSSGFNAQTGSCR